MARFADMLKPDILAFGLYPVYLALGFLLVSPLLAHIHLIPCSAEGVWMLCTINPLGMPMSSDYFGNFVLDYLYQGLYLFFLLVIPYVFSSISIHLYKKHVQRLVNV